MIAKYYNYPGPFCEELLCDMSNTYRREFLINGLPEKTDLMILTDFLKGLFPPLFDAVGTSIVGTIIKLKARKGSQAPKHIINLDAFKSKEEKEEPKSHKMYIPFANVTVNIKPNKVD